MLSFLQVQLNRLKFALAGLLHAYRRDKHFNIILLYGVALIVFGYFFWPLSSNELVFLIFSFVLIFITELHNTSLETALDRLHPERHDDIGASKDISAAATLVAVAFSAMLLIIIALEHLS